MSTGIHKTRITIEKVSELSRKIVFFFSQNQNLTRLHQGHNSGAKKRTLRRKNLIFIT